MRELKERFFKVRFPNKQYSYDAYWEMIGFINIEPRWITGREDYLLDVSTFGKTADAYFKRIIKKHKGVIYE